MSEMVVLHISDLHFGIENDRSEKTKYIRPRQKEMIKSLLDTIEEIVIASPEWKPNVVAISGDIAWSGKREEYQLYKEFFVKPLIELLAIEEKHIITCPGNHDIIRERAKRVSRYSRDSKGKDPDVPDLNQQEMEDQAFFFGEYVDELCNGDAKEICKAITFEEWPWATFLILNSAWDCRNDDDEGRLRVGLSILENLIEKAPENNCVITLFHHPHTEVEDIVEEIDRFSHQKILNNIKRQWLHVSEREPDFTGERTFCSYVEEKSTYILNGHIHKETEPQKLGKSTRLVSGTIYSNDTPRYHCRLLKVSNNGQSTYRDLRHTIGARSGNWEVTSPKKFQFEHVFTIISRKAEQEEKERQLGIRLQEAKADYDSKRNLEKYLAVVDEVTKELLHTAIVPSDVLNQRNVIESDKTTKIEDVHVYTLRNDGEK
ncbi:MAG: metallophosphoesterase [Roseburia sp.]|nr:metallophosphoesterase [Roseburia sp.]